MIRCRWALFDAVHAHLKGRAGLRLARGARGTLDMAALAHEPYPRLDTSREPSFEHSAQFFAHAPRAMRHVLTDRARSHMRRKAGGDAPR